jgi:DNA-binding transcriptional regulator of glucitol operon
MPEFNFAYIFIILAAAYALQLLLTGWQAKRFFRRMKEIRKDGLTSIGLSGSKWSGRIYAVLVVDANKKILHAEKLSGFTIFSQLQPVDELIGVNARLLLDEECHLVEKKKLMEAFRNAAKDIFKAEINDQEENPEEGTA